MRAFSIVQKYTQCLGLSHIGRSNVGRTSLSLCRNYYRIVHLPEKFFVCRGSGKALYASDATFRDKTWERVPRYLLLSCTRA
jgi:hypothetical protein